MADKPKRVVRCRSCSMCAEHTPCGFATSTRLHCTMLGTEVEPGDGCTFGTKGEHQRATTAPDVTIAGYEAIHGF